MPTIFDREEFLWILIVGFFLTFLLVASVGANSVPNAFGTSIGAKALSRLQAVILAGIFMTLGAVIIGPAVAETIENSIIDITLYESNVEQLMLGQLAVIMACAAWKIIATIFKLPVAITHSVVGSVVGFHVTAFGFEGINWITLLFIAVSWVTSPILSGIAATIFYKIVLKTIVEKENQIESGLKSLPVWFGFVISINVLSVALQLQAMFALYPSWLIILAQTLGSGIVAGVLVRLFLVPRLRREHGSENDALVTDELELSQRGKHNDEAHSSVDEATGIDDKTTHRKSTDEPLLDESNQLDTVETDNHDIARLCSPLLVVSAVFAAYVYGSILVSTGVAPLITIWNVYETGNVSSAVTNPFWMFLYGSAALTIGFALVGERLTETIGEGITALSPSRAFPIEFGSTLVLLVASNLGLPVATPHCKVGAIAAVGYYNNGNVNFRLLSKIVLAWVVTLPVTTLISAGLMALFEIMYHNYGEVDVLTPVET